MGALPPFAASSVRQREPFEVIMAREASRTSNGDAGERTRTPKERQPHRDLNPARLPVPPPPPALSGETFRPQEAYDPGPPERGMNRLRPIPFVPPAAAAFPAA